MSGTIEVRRVGPDEAGLLARYDEDIFDEAVEPAYLATYLAQPQNMLIVALDGDLVVGQCQAMVHTHPDQPPTLYLDNLGVAPSHQRRGIARRLVTEMMAWGRERGCAEAWVATEPDNEPARALYAALKGEPVQDVVYYAYKL
jgi:ribosomal protein S18 acetylase RimI-like enzyme